MQKIHWVAFISRCIRVYHHKGKEECLLKNDQNMKENYWFINLFESTSNMTQLHRPAQAHKVAKQNMLTRIRLPAKLASHKNNLWLVSCSFLLSRNVSTNISRMKLSPGINWPIPVLLNPSLWQMEKREGFGHSVIFKVNHMFFHKCHLMKTMIELLLTKWNIYHQI